MKSSIIFCVVLFTGMLPVVVNCQSDRTAAKVPDCSVSRIKPKPSNLRPISLGVINGRALRLVTPGYPAAALAVNVRGSVQIQVIIDEAGCTAEAKAISGHPLLIPASLKAATDSVFAPTLLSGRPIRVFGIITYNYRLDRMNWLELGFFSDSYEIMSEYVPTDFDLELKLLRKSKDLPWEEKQEMLETVRKSLINKLVTEPKSKWLFETGRDLQLLSSGFVGRRDEEEVWSPLRVQMDNVPSDVSPRLKIMINDLLSSTDPTETNQKLRDIEHRLFALGN
jgi:hypothetical protein